MQADVTNEKQWCLDSEASSHMCSKKEKFHEIEKTKTQILNLASSNSTKIEGSGTVKLNTKEGVTAKLQ